MSEMRPEVKAGPTLRNLSPEMESFSKKCSCLTSLVGAAAALLRCCPKARTEHSSRAARMGNVILGFILLRLEIDEEVKLIHNNFNTFARSNK